MPDATHSHLQERILSRIDERDCGHETPCWISNRAAQPNGYTKIGIDNRTWLTHRAAYTAWTGAIPDGLVIDHLCNQPACCNPDHLAAVTQRENLMRSESGSAFSARKTHCLNGHPLSGENLYVRPDRPSHRGCRACRSDATMRSQRKRKQHRQAA